MPTATGWLVERRLDRFKFRLCCYHWNTVKEIKSGNHRIK